MSTSSTSHAPAASPPASPYGVARRGTGIVALAVVWQGLGTSVVGAVVRPELATFTTSVAFLVAGVLAAAAWVVRRRVVPAGAPGTRRTLSVRDVVVVNVVTAGAFSAFYVAAALVPPTVASVVETGVGPLAVAVALLVARRRREDLRQPAVVLAASLVVGWIAMGVFPHDPATRVLGIALSVLAGLCAAGVLLTSSSLARRGVTAAQISAVRFHLAWVLTGVLGVPAALRLGPAYAGDISVAAVVGVTCIAAPILMLQWGITLAPPSTSALLICTLPAVVLAGDVVLTGEVHAGLLVSMGALVLVSLAGLRRPRPRDDRARGNSTS